MLLIKRYWKNENNSGIILRIVKGRSEAIAIYEILDGELPDIRNLKLQTLSDFEN